ncbi:MAG TPA: hypothetical protein VM912_06600 [Terriglobales bacterium]|nr:hypothetical protein [Terriglobales bacterium]
MAFRYNVDPESHTVLVEFSGRSSMDESIALRKMLVSDPRFRDTYNELVDLRRLSASESDFSDFRTRGASMDPFSKYSRRAVAAPSDFAYGMARMYATVRAPEATFAVFRSLREACDWLRLDDSAMQQLSL